MDITIKREALLAAMTPLAALFNRNEGLQLTASGERLELVAGNEEVEMRSATRCEMNVEGKTIFRGRSLFDFVRALDDGREIDIHRKDDGFIYVSSGGSRFKFAQVPEESFKGYEHVGAKDVLVDITLTAKQVQDHIQRIMHSIGKNDVRAWVNGVLFHFQGEKLIVVTTNGHALSAITVEHGGKAPDEAQFIVPGSCMNEIIKLATATNDAQSRFRFTSSALRVDAPAGVYKTRLLGGKFADYQQVFPNHKDTVSIAASELAEAVTRAGLLSGADRAVRLNINRGGVVVSAASEESEGREEVGATSVIEEGRIAFNADYIIGALKAVEDETVNIVMADSTSAVLILDPSTPSLRQVVMPLRV